MRRSVLANITLERILDTTLREGEQAPNVYFKPEEKCAIAEMLYKALGPKCCLEIGQPYNPSYKEGVEAVARHFKELGLSDAILQSHCRVLRNDVDVAWSCGTNGITVFLAASEKHLLYKLNGLSYEDALKRIRDVIRYAKDEVGFEFVEYTLEDATSLPLEKTIEVSKCAEDAGVDMVKIPDTKGQANPEGFKEIIAKLVDEIDVPVDLHCHNDRGLAVANSLAGLEGGARSVNVAVMGIGERCGIADLTTVVENLESLYGVETGVDFKRIPQLYAYVSAVTGMAIAPSAPVLGLHARTHKAGTHQKAVLQDPETYETINWSKYGLEREYEFGAMQSKELIYKLMEGCTSDDLKKRVVDRIRDVSMQKGRPLRRQEVWHLIESETGMRVAPSADPADSIYAMVFMKVKPSCDEPDLIKAVKKAFLDESVPITIMDVTGDWDFIIDARGVKSFEQLDRLTDRIRRENSDILETSTSIVFDEYR
jgi:isopropylmalate/homocitrate/citramalate synthase